MIDDEASEPDTMDPDPLPIVTLSADRTRASVGDVVMFTVKRNRPADVNDDTWQRISNTKHRVDIRIGGHMGVFRDHDDITEWEPIVRMLHPGEMQKVFPITVWPEKNCARTPGRKIEAFLFNAYYYGDNLNRDVNDVGYKVGDPSSVNIVVEVPSGGRQPTGAPTISGNLDVDETLTADVSKIRDADGLSNVSYEYQWYRGSNPITGATHKTYNSASSR